MRVKSIKIQNYKSFAQEDNIIKLESINTVIGKNESGKSNLIEAIGKIDLTGIKDNQYFKNKNKNNIGEDLYISLVLVPYDDDKEIYNSEEETILTINDKMNIKIDGGLKEVIRNNQNFQYNRAKMNELNKNIRFSDEDKRKQFLELMNMIKNAEEKIFINSSYVQNIISILEKDSNYEEFTKYLKHCIEYLLNLYTIFPQFILLDNIELKSKYTRKELEDNKKQNKMLEYLLKVIEIDFEELMSYWKFSNESDKYNFEKDMNEKIEILMKQFNKFYEQEEVKFEAKFDNESLNFLIKTTNKYLELSERSNGLRWYLNMYIQLFAKTQKANMKNYVILLDEPGVYLHVNAQKEILKLFEDFTLNNNQIIYTTQLPTMIYQDDLYRIKTIIKDEEGNSNIGNSYNSLPHKMKSKQETISPVLIAIGMKMGYSFSAMSSDSINIITEGISDYNYIKAFLLQKNTIRRLILFLL